MKTKLYKLTDAQGYTRKDKSGETQWCNGFCLTKKPCANPQLCSCDVIHAYTNKNLAFLLNRIHANIQDPQLWEAEGEIVVRDWEKVGCFSLAITKKLKTPDWIKTCLKDAQIWFGILCAESVLKYFEDKYPKDNRPRKAIEAAKEYLKASAAYNVADAAAASAAANVADAAADAAYAAYNVADAAADAAYNVAAAADAAYNVADAAADAADAAYNVADAAADAADAAARAAYAAFATVANVADAATYAAHAAYDAAAAPNVTDAVAAAADAATYAAHAAYDAAYAKIDFGALADKAVELATNS